MSYAYDPSTFIAFCVMMKEATEEEKERFLTRSKSMPYKEFLETPYWGMIRGWVTRERKKCQFCGSRWYLSVHHRTYEHRGSEWENLDDLELLCRDCHTNKHGLATTKQVADIMKRRMNAWKYSDKDDFNNKRIPKAWESLL